MDAAEHAARLAAEHDNASAAELLRAVLSGPLAGQVALVSSFGADSAVLLHLAAAVDRAVPVIFIDTYRHFAETLAYRDQLTALLGLSNVRAVGPSAEDVARLDPELLRAGYDPDGCCDFRKTKPLELALAPFTAWISGRKRFQAETRRSLPLVEAEDGKIKINPLASWNAEEIEAYRLAHDLPAHPLVAQGYRSIGCAPCTARTAPNEDPRAGRWRGFAKTECGIHIGDGAA